MSDEKVFCNDLQPGTHVRVTDGAGKESEFTVRRMIPMQMYNNGNLEPISDIEILLDKSKNIYFSYERYLSGESWVKKVEILS